jgi:hypothetical protein
MSLQFYFRFEIKRQSSPNQIERSVVGNAFDLLILGKGVLTLVRFLIRGLDGVIFNIKMTCSTIFFILRV